MRVFISHFNLNTLSNASAEGLATLKTSLTLNGSSISDSVAQILSRSQTFNLWLEGITSLSDSAAESLSKFKGHLVLNHLKTISDSPGHLALAKKLSKGDRDCGLNLGGLESLSETVAKLLIKYEGELCLVSLKNLSDGVAKILDIKKALARKKSKIGTVILPADARCY